MELRFRRVSSNRAPSTRATREFSKIADNLRKFATPGLKFRGQMKLTISTGKTSVCLGFVFLENIGNTTSNSALRIRLTVSLEGGDASRGRATSSRPFSDAIPPWGRFSRVRQGRSVGRGGEEVRTPRSLVVMVTSVDPSAFFLPSLAALGEGRRVRRRPPDTSEGLAHVSLGRESVSAACACTHNARGREGKTAGAWADEVPF